jgi:hypothetical protein
MATKKKPKPIRLPTSAKQFIKWCNDKITTAINIQKVVDEDLRKQGFAVPEHSTPIQILEGIRGEVNTMYEEFTNTGTNTKINTGTNTKK